MRKTKKNKEIQQDTPVYICDKYVVFKTLKNNFYITNFNRTIEPMVFDDFELAVRFAKGLKD